MNDAQRLVRDALVGLLDDFGVPWEETHRKRHPAIEFVVNGQRHVQIWSSGDPRTAHNAKSQLRHRLLSLGASLPTKTVYDTEKSEQSNPEPPAPAQEPSTPTMNETMEDPIPQPAAETPSEPTASDPPPSASPRTYSVDNKVNPDGRHRVFRSARVIAIELDDDLLIAKGNVLVIPLNRPNSLMDLRPDQFRALFEQQNMLPAPTPPATQRVSPTPPVQTPPQKPLGASRTASVASPIPTQPRKPVAPPAPSRAGVAVRPANPRMEIRATAPTPRREPEPPPRPSIQRTQRERPDGLKVDRRRGIIQPQLGRILAALVHAIDTSGDEYVAPITVAPYLDARDNRQFTARIPKAIERNLASRGEQLESYRGWYYGITPSGRDIIQQAGTWPYTCEGMEPPEWLETMLEEVAE